MIGTIRKHSTVLWWTLVPLTIISFVVFMGSGPARSGGGRSGGGEFGTIYGHQITAQEFTRARGAYYLYYWMRNNGQWPDKTASVNRDETEQGIYIRLLLSQKAQFLGIHVGEDALVTAASEFLRSFSRNGQPVDLNKFVEQYLAPEGLGLADLQNFLRDELVVQQMTQVLGLAGALVTPQEAGQLYDGEHQELAAQAVFFAASNYLAQVAVTPAAVAQFYTNNMAAYREPDRVQVTYVFFNVTNCFVQSKAEWAKTNFTETVDSIYRQYGQSQFPEAKTPEEAKAKITELLIRDRALRIARQQANGFATAVFALQPVKLENLAAYAKQTGLAAVTTAPFSASYGPAEFAASTAFIKNAFQLNADEPFAGPIPAVDGFYVVALANQLPSMIPALDQISSRVVSDFTDRSAVDLAQRAGMIFYNTATNQMAAGKSFAQAAIAGGQAPQLLPPFSLSTAELSVLGDRATIGQLKQAAFTTLPGKMSGFQPTGDGGFVLFVQQLLPVDATKKKMELPQFTAQVRRGRQNEAFNRWLQSEANRELRSTPFFNKMSAGQPAQ